MRDLDPSILFLRFRERGDADALAKVFDATAPKLLAIARHLARGLGEAEDLVQATFLAAIEARRSFDPTRPVEPWLVGILANQAGLARRRAARAIEASRLEPAASKAPADEAIERETWSAIARAVEGLPRPYREVVEPKLIQGERGIDIARR